MESIAVPISITVRIHPEGADIGSLERAVGAGLTEAGQRMWQELLGSLERSLVVGRGHVGCGGILKHPRPLDVEGALLEGILDTLRKECQPMPGPSGIEVAQPSVGHGTRSSVEAPLGSGSSTSRRCPPN